MDYNARFYSPVLNRFIQPDSIVPNPVNPQAWNRFSYVYNRPINFNDPTGHWGSSHCQSIYCSSIWQTGSSDSSDNGGGNNGNNDDGDEDSIIEGGGYVSVAQPDDDEVLFYSNYLRTTTRFGCALHEQRVPFCTHKYHYVLTYKQADNFRDYLHDLAVSPFVIDSGNPVLAVAIDKGFDKASLYIGMFLSSLEDVFVNDYDNLYHAVSDTQSSAQDANNATAQTMYVTVYQDPVSVTNGFESMGRDIVIISATDVNPVMVTLNTSVASTINGLNILITNNK